MAESRPTRKGGQLANATLAAISNLKETAAAVERVSEILQPSLTRPKGSFTAAEFAAIKDIPLRTASDRLSRAVLRGELKRERVVGLNAVGSLRGLWYYREKESPDEKAAPKRSVHNSRTRR